MIRGSWQTVGWCAGTAVVAATCAAGPVEIAADHRGNIRGDNFAANGSAAGNNYFAGVAGYESRNWFVFDLAGVADQITGATLRLDTHRVVAETDGFADYLVTETSATVADLVAAGGGSTTFNALGTGTTWGTISVADTADNQEIAITLNAAAIAYLNGHLGQSVALSGRVINIGGAVDALFDLTDSGDSSILELTVVPLPSGAGLALAGLGAVSLARRRRLG